MSDERPGGSDHPEEPEEPQVPDWLADLPPEVRSMLESLGGPDALERVQEQLGQLFSGGMPAGFAVPGAMGGTGPTGPVDWQLATRVALQLAADGDRGPTPDERARVVEAFDIAEHWLDDSPLPAPPDAGRLVVDTRQTWVNAAVRSLGPLVEPVARAATDAMADLAREQLSGLDQEGLTALGMEGLPPGFEHLLEQLSSQDPAELLRPAGAALAGLQAGQVIGQLSRQLVGQYDLGIPTAPRAEAHHLVVNFTEDFAGYGLEEREVAVVLALTEAAHRRLYHAVPWLESHVASLVARFAAGTEIDAERLRDLSEELAMGVDPDDPESLRRAMEQANRFQLEPTDQQRRVLERLQGVVCLIGAWARHEVDRAAAGRLPAYARIQEVLRRRRATRGDGEELLAQLLGLDLKPADESLGEQFVQAVEAARGPAGLHEALSHPENLPDGAELADPTRWLDRTAQDTEVPDDVSELFDGLGEAPREPSAEERRTGHDDDGRDDQGEDQDGGGPSVG